MSARSAGSTAAADRELAAQASHGSGEYAKAPHLSVRERAERGKAERAEVARDVHGEWSAPSGRRDPVELLEEQAASRVPELVPIRYGRMLVSPFTFYRGAAYLMAADLAGSQRTGLRVQLCGDAHLSNFGGFAAPDRRLVFDINDFDETLPGPFEWDLKRLVASFAVAGRDLGFAPAERRGVNLAVTRSYREAMRALESMKTLDLWYSRVDAEALIAQFQSTASAKRRKLMEKNLAKTRAKDSLRAFSKLTTVVEGEPRIAGDPPLIVPIEELAEGRDIEEFARSVNRGYRRTLQGDRKHLLERFRYAHAARKVVGVGSVGTRAWIMLMLGRDNDDPLFLQLKEAQPSVLEPFLGKSQYPNHGQRVVEGQRLMQAASDIMLGWHRIDRHRPRQTRLLLPPAVGQEGLGDHRGHETQRAQPPTPKSAAGHWPAPTPARATPSRSAHTSARATPWTGHSPTSPSSTPTRTNSTMPHWQPRPRPDASTR